MDPGLIQKLDECVVNRIAAGEVIQRPANAVKELIENSLDAKSTSIQVIVKCGGLKFLQIIDNGTGVRKEDMEIVCNRFTTSKLTSFDDLSNIATFGFRGEALASISHVAHLSIQTKTRTEQSAYRGLYVDGKLMGPLSLCAGSQGTTITVEDLFFNVPQRKQAMKSSADEFQKIADVIIRYAIHNFSVAFLLKKQGENPFIRTLANSEQSDIIKKLYGSQVFQNLVPVNINDDLYKFRVKALVTNVTYSCKKTVFILFINNRLVESIGLKNRVELAYSLFLSKGGHPFVYMALEVDSMNLDVNTHPTKNEVHFLNESDIIQRIGSAMEAELLKSKTTKKMYQQLKLSQFSNDTKCATNEKIEQNVDYIKASTIVRTDAKNQKLEKFFVNPVLSTNVNKISENKTTKKTIARKSSLSSINALRQQIESDCNEELRKIIKSMVFVGVVSRTFSLFQYETKLYLCNMFKLSVELFYQLMITNFGNFKKIRYNPSLSIEDLMIIEMECNGWNKNDKRTVEVIKKAAEVLKEKSMLLRDYFSLNINAMGELETIPMLLENYDPCVALLPSYLLNISAKVNWECEKECFETFCRETAKFYSDVIQSESISKTRKWTLEHVITPSLKKYLLPNNEVKNYMFEITNLQSLYKVFERC